MIEDDVLTVALLRLEPNLHYQQVREHMLIERTRMVESLVRADADNSVYIAEIQGTVRGIDLFLDLHDNYTGDTSE